MAQIITTSNIDEFRQLAIDGIANKWFRYSSAWFHGNNGIRYRIGFSHKGIDYTGFFIYQFVGNERRDLYEKHIDCFSQLDSHLKLIGD